MRIFKIAKTLDFTDLINVNEDVVIQSMEHLVQTLKPFNPNVVDLDGKKALTFTLNKAEYILFDETFPVKSEYLSFEEAREWIWEIDPLDFSGMFRDFVDDFWQSCPPLYHATTEENKTLIFQQGILPQHITRGIGNRRVNSAVFTTTEQDDLLLGYYGPAIFKIDTAMMKADGYTPGVSMEPTEQEADEREAIAWKIGLEDFQCDRESGISPNTVIVFGKIPPKYLSLL